MKPRTPDEVQGRMPGLPAWSVDPEFRELRREFRPFESRARLELWNDLSYVEMLGRATELPSGSAIVFALYTADVDGVLHPGDRALIDLRSHAARRAATAQPAEPAPTTT